ncbi:MAG: hypothetical protein QM820_24685 [Minicystis sp.]
MFGRILLFGIGSVLAASSLARAVRFLRALRRRPPEPLYAPPWAGAYRTRPAVPPPPEPPPPPPKLRDPRLQALGYALLSTLFAVGGALMAIFPHRAPDRFWGLICGTFFGAGAWVFWEQLAAGASLAPLPLRARRRALAVLALGGLGTIHAAAVADQVAPGDRLFGGGTGVLMVALGVVALWRSAKRG